MDAFFRDLQFKLKKKSKHQPGENSCVLWTGNVSYSGYGLQSVKWPVEGIKETREGPPGGADGREGSDKVPVPGCWGGSQPPVSQQAVCEHGTPGDRTALHKPGADPLLPAGALHRSPLPALSYVNHVTWYLYLDITVHLSFFLHGNNLMYVIVYLYILMHDHVYSTHHLFSSFS